MPVTLRRATHKSHFIALPLWLVLFCAATTALAASTQDYPTKPIRIVTSGVGGGNDFAARLIAPGLTNALKQQVIVDNRPTVIIAAEIVARAAADGYVILFSGSPLWISPLMQKVSYDTSRDYSPISMVVSTPNVVATHPTLVVNSIRELIALAKAKPGAINGAGGSSGSTPHLALELFNAMAGVNIVRIAFKSSGPAVASLVSGEVNLMFATAGSVAPHVKSGRLKALAVTSAKPSALFPGLPTVSESGVPGYESSSPFGIFGPAKLPANIVNRLQQETARVLASPDIKERFLEAGVETFGTPPDQLAAMVKSEVIKLGKVIRDAGIKEN